MDYEIKDKKLASEGQDRIEWAEKRMPVLRTIRERFAEDKPLKELRIGACLHVTAETANLMRTVQAGGAEVILCASNPLSTQDDIAAALVKKHDIPVFAIRGEDDRTYYRHIEQVLESRPNITMDDGGDLISGLHARYKTNKSNRTYTIEDNGKEWEFYGSSEETTTGVVRLKAMDKDGTLKVPVVAVNDSYTKYLFDNRYGTGQSTIDGILRATNILLAGKKFLVCGYGWCGRGLAARAQGMGAEVIVTEVDPMRALEAKMDGFQVQTLAHALKNEKTDIVVTTTGNKHVVDKQHFELMLEGSFLAISVHFNVEINLEALEKMAVKKRRVREFVLEYVVLAKRAKRKEQNYSVKSKNTGVGWEEQFNSEKIKQSGNTHKRIYVLGDGRLINLVAAEGHPADVMDMSFANQALAAEWFVEKKGKLKPKVYKLPEELDNRVARLKLKAMGLTIDELTKEQKEYLDSWTEGT